MNLEPRIVVINLVIASVNDWMYGHWRAYTKVRDTWMVYIRQQMRQQEPPSHPVSMILTSYRGRVIDYGNLVGGAKPIPDCLKRLGYIKDDSPAWFNCEYKQFKTPKARQHCTILRFITPIPV